MKPWPSSAIKTCNAMKKTGLILLGGLLLISHSHWSSSRVTKQNTSAAVSHSYTACPMTSEVSYGAVSDASAEPTILSEPAVEQRTALSGRLLQLAGAFAELVMVI